MSNSKAGYLLKNTAIIATGSMFAQAVAFLLLPVYTAFLSASDYGVVDLAQSYAGLIGPLITLQMGMTVFQFLIDARNNEKKTAEIVSTAAAAVAALLCCFVSLSLLAMRFVHITHAIIILSMIVLGAVSTVFGQIVRGMGHNAIFAIGGIISGLVSALIGSILIVCLHMGASGIMIAISGSALSACIYYTMALKIYRLVRFTYIDRQLLPKMLRYALPLIPASLSWWIIGTSDRTIIAFFLGTNANGIYALASKFALLFATIYSFFNMSWVESVSLHINSQDRDVFFSAVANATIKFFGSMTAGVIAVVPIIFDVVIGKGFHTAYVYIPILVFAAFCNAIIGNYSAIYFAKKMTRSTATTAALAAIINILFSLALIRYIGLYAPALATIVGYGVMAIYRHYDTKKYVRINYEPLVFVKVLSLIAFATVCYYADTPLLNIASLAVVVAISLWLNRSFIAIFKTKLLSAGQHLKRKLNLLPDIQI